MTRAVDRCKLCPQHTRTGGQHVPRILVATCAAAAMMIAACSKEAPAPQESSYQKELQLQLINAKPGDVYVVYLKHGEPTTLDLTVDPVTFTLRWFDPKTGEYAGTQADVRGGAPVRLAPPERSARDWVAYLRAG